jgi:histone deacetylase 6
MKAACGARCGWVDAREVTTHELRLAGHTTAHIENIEQTRHVEEGQTTHFGADTYANRHSALAARLAAGTATEMALRIASKLIRNGAAFVRPPGHHACTATAMGFCLYNNAVVAARAVQVREPNPQCTVTLPPPAMRIVCKVL